MRALLFIPFLLVFTSNLVAQSIEDLNLAEAYYQERNFEKAKFHIDLAIQDPKVTNMAKTWFYFGKIYYSVGTLSETPNFSEEKLIYQKMSAHGLIKAKSLDNKNEYSESIDKTLRMMNEVFLNEGLINFNAKDYSNALTYYELGTSVSESLGLLDTIAIYNTALAYEKLNQVEKAVANYRTCADLDYGGAAVYDFMYNLLYINRQNDKASEVLAEGRTKYPNDISLLRSQLGEYTKKNQPLMALDAIDEAIESKPETAMLYLMRGALKEKIKMESSEVISDYQMAIDLREDYFDGNQKLGVYYYKLGTKTIKESCKITNKGEANMMEQQGMAELRNALTHLEKARSLKSYDRRTLETLKLLYSKLDMTEKYKEVMVDLSN